MIIENKTTENGDVLRISTDVPVLGLVLPSVSSMNLDGKTIILYVGLLNVYYDENQFSVIKNSSIEQGFNQIS